MEITSRETKIMHTSSQLTIQDILGSWKARWGINRMNFKVEPGLYSSSTFTSFSGVLKEMKIAIPAIIISAFLGTVLILLSSFIKV